MTPEEVTATLAAMTDGEWPWRAYADDEYAVVEMSGPDDYFPIGAANEQNRADARGIAMIRNLFPEAWAVVEAARRLLEAPVYHSFDNPYDERMQPYEDTRAALAALDAKREAL